MSSIAICRPNSMFVPKAAPGPVRAIRVPTLMGSAAIVTPAMPRLKITTNAINKPFLRIIIPLLRDLKSGSSPPERIDKCSP